MTEKELIFNNLYDFLERYFSPKPDDTLLDVGCGRYGFARFYSQKVGRYIGLDVDDIASYLEGQEFLQYDGLHIPLDDSSIDIVVSHSVMEHVDNVPQVMAEINRVLKVGGIAYLTINPLYYSAWGSHLFDPAGHKLDHWEHLDPVQACYMTTNPRPDADSTGHYLNQLGIAEFLHLVGLQPWTIIRFERLMDSQPLPEFLRGHSIPLVDLLSYEFRLIGQKVAPIASGSYRWSGLQTVLRRAKGWA
jgi:SAM-dependent methyltransferase